MSTPQVEDIFRLSPMQEGLLFHSLDDPGAAYYVDQVVYRLHGALDTDCFERTWTLLCRRHPVLRTSFHWEGIKELVQVVHRDAAPTLTLLDWRHLSTEEQAAEREEHLRAERLRGLDLTRPPLVRLTLIRTADDDHTFVFQYHHMLVDAWSGLMLLGAAFDLYERLAGGEPVRVEPARSFRDYVSWARNRDLAEAEEYWRAALRGAEPVQLPIVAPEPRLAAPADRDNPEQVLRLGPDVVGRLRATATRHGLTLGSLLQTGWALLLGRYTGSGDVVFGSTLASRPSEVDGVEEIAGLFINTLPVRVRLGTDEPVSEVCARLQRDQAELRRFDYSPLAQVQQWSDVPAGAPLFDTIMTVLNVPGIDVLRGTDGRITVRAGEYRYRTNYPISVLAIPEADELTVRVGYDPARVRYADVERLLGHLETVLRAVADDAGVLVADVPLLRAEERDRLLRDWAGASPAEAATLLAHQVIEAVADAGPSAVAVVHGETSVTYAELDERANRLAHHLRAQGVRAESRVGLCLSRGPEQIVAMLAVWKAGGAFVPLDSAYPEARLAHIVADAAIDVLVTERDLRARLPRTGGRTVLLDAHRARIGQQPAGRPEPVGSPDGLAYVIYTSGSTGGPKGVQITHAGVGNLIAAQRAVFGRGPGDRALQWASASFDASVFETVLGLGCGGTVCTATQEELMPGRPLAELLARQRITALTITPSALAAVPVADLPALKLLVVAGEQFPGELARRWSAPGRTVVNAYGPTEATVWVTWADCAEFEQSPGIGSPVPGAVVRVLDRLGRPTPIGVAGELHVGGAGVARGYLNRPDLTTDRFVPDPFTDVPGARLYRTGDLVRWTETGGLDFLGRVDRQVKVRGFRVETAEVEAVLLARPAVAECAVLARSSGPGADAPIDTLVAYVVGDGSGAVDAEELRRAAGEVLPEHMVPGMVVELDALPLTPNGKLDVAALPTPAEAIARARTGTGTDEPRTEMESAVAALWRQVLGADDVGPGDDFFVLGGNSIKATQLASRVRKAWQVEVPIRAIFDNRTVESFAALVEEALVAQLAELSDEDAGRLAADGA